MLQSDSTKNFNSDCDSADSSDSTDSIKNEGVVDISKYQSMEEKTSAESSAFDQVMSQMNIADHHAFEKKYQEYWLQASENDELLSVVVCEIDFFQAYCDNYGHQGAAFMLLVVGLALKNINEKHGGYLARYRGNEFAILLKGGDVETTQKIAEELRLAVEASRTEHKYSDISDVATLSIGTSSVYPTSMKVLIKKSEHALESAKSSGRNKVCATITKKMDNNTLRLNTNVSTTIASEAVTISEPVTLDVEPVSVNVEPVSVNIEPVSVNVEPVTVNVEPINLDLEPVSLDIEPVGLDIEPVGLDIEPVGLDIEPVGLDVEPVGLDVEPVTLDAEVEAINSDASIERYNDPHKSDFERLMAEMKIPDRRDFNRFFVNAWQQASLDQELLSMIICEVDFFSEYVENHPQQTSDDVLLIVACTLKSKCEEFDGFIARIEGAKFVALITGGNATKGLKVAEALRVSIQELAMVHAFSPVKNSLTMSLGLANILPSDGNSMKMLMLNTDNALNSAKSAGYDQISVA